MPHDQLTAAGPDHGLPVNAPVPAPDVVLTTSEAAHLMRVSTRTLERLAETGEGPPRVQLTGRRVGYWRSDVMAWLKARTSSAKRAA